jgi:hypothetical protein
LNIQPFFITSIVNNNLPKSDSHQTAPAQNPTQIVANRSLLATILPIVISLHEGVVFPKAPNFMLGVMSFVFVVVYSPPIYWGVAFSKATKKPRPAGIEPATFGFEVQIYCCNCCIYSMLQACFGAKNSLTSG